MKTLLKASSLLFSPLLLASFGMNDDRQVVHEFVRLGVEGSVNLEKIRTAVNANLVGDEPLYTTMVSMLNSQVFEYASDNNKHPNFGMTFAAIGRFNLSKNGAIIAKFGITPALEESIALLREDGKIDSDGVLKSNLVMSPSVFFGYKGLFLGMGYDLRKYDFPRNHSEPDANLTEAIKDYQLTYSVRAEKEFELNNISMIFGFEGMTSFYRETESDFRDYYSNVLRDDSFADDKGFTISSVENKIMRLSATLGMTFLSF